MISTSNDGIFVECSRKNNTTFVYLLSNSRQVLKYLKTNVGLSPYHSVTQNRQVKWPINQVTAY